MVTRDSLQGGHGDAAAYALGALDANARVRFESHATVCPECNREVADLQPVADALAGGVPQVEPPPSLRHRLLTRASLTLPARITESVPLQALPPLQPVPVSLAVVAQRPWWHLSHRLTSGIAGASLALALASGGYAFAAHQEMRETSVAAARLSETLSIMYQPGVVPKTLTGTSAAPYAKGKVYLVPDGTHAVVMTYGMPRLNRNETYQCWLMNDEQKRLNGGAFTVDENGRGHWVVRTPQMLMRYRDLGITREPGKGSPGPTGPKVLGGEL